jgi:hypothetical protein
MTLTKTVTAWLRYKSVQMCVQGGLFTERVLDQSSHSVYGTWNATYEPQQSNAQSSKVYNFSFKCLFIRDMLILHTNVGLEWLATWV